MITMLICVVSGILRPTQAQQSEVKGILKSPPAAQTGSTVRGILKSDTGITEDPTPPSSSKLQGILKKESPTNIVPTTGNEGAIRGILKKESSFESKTEPEKSALKKPLTKSQESGDKGILKASEGRTVVKDDEGSGSSTSAKMNVQRSKVESVQGVSGVMPGSTGKQDSGMFGGSEKTASVVESRTTKFQRTVKDEKQESQKTNLWNSSRTKSLDSSDQITQKGEGKTANRSQENGLDKNGNSLDSVKVSSKTEKSITKTESNTSDKARVSSASQESMVTVRHTELKATLSQDSKGSKSKTSTPSESDRQVGRSSSLKSLGPPRTVDSSTEEESSTSSERMSWIKNEAIARRRLRRMEEKEK